MKKEELLDLIKIKFKLESDLEEIRLEEIRSIKKEKGEKLLNSDRYNTKKYEVIELRGDDVYLRTILCISSIDNVKIPLYKIRHVNIYQLSYELNIKIENVK